MTEDELKIIIFPFKVGKEHYVNAIELQDFKLWKVDKQECKELDLGVLNLLLSLTDECSVLRDYTIEPETANMPQKGQILKSRVGNSVTDKFAFPRGDNLASWWAG